MKKNSRVRKAAHDIRLAKRALGAARRKLAVATPVAEDAAVIEPQWRWATQVLHRNAERLRKIPGVTGFTVSCRVRDGMPTDEVCIKIFVREKLAKSALKKRRLEALPRSLSYRGRRIGIDVVQLGKLRRQAFLGESVGPVTPLRNGTLGGIARDSASGRTVAITAMHVSGLKQLPHPQRPPVPVCVPSRVENPHSPLFGAVVRGSMRGIDACAIDLQDSASLEPRILGIGLVRGWRPVVVPADRGTSVRMFGAVSQLQFGVIDEPFIALPEYDLDGAILVRIPTRRGDSGAALVDRENLILGFLVGRADETHQNLAVFCPAALVLQRLGCEIPTENVS